jgi:hypothetical protein
VSEGFESDPRQLIGAHAKQNFPRWAKAGDWRTHPPVRELATIYFRQPGSPESKPVGAPHDQTGTSG